MASVITTSKEGYREKATELRINRRIVRRRLREEAKENVRAEELREKAYKQFEILEFSLWDQKKLNDVNGKLFV